MRGTELFRKSLIRWSCLIAIACMGLAAGVLAGESKTASSFVDVNYSAVGVFPRGVSYEGISLEGKTLQQAQLEIQQYVNERLLRKIQWNVCGDTYEYNAASFETALTNPEVLDQLEALTMSGNLVDQYKKQKDLDQNPVDLDLKFAYNTELVKDQVAGYAQIYTKSVSNASVRRENGQFIVTEAVTGISFDQESICVQLGRLMADFNSTEDIVYDFPYTETAPDYTGDIFRFSATPLGSFSTSGLGDEDRTQNIALAAQNINGKLFFPGEGISALAMYGPITAEAGFRYAPGYNQGRQEMTIGGGICQITTTLYNAVLRAELGIAVRKNHSMMVNYVPPAMDAMVAPSSNSDFIFVNTSNYPIFIESYTYDDAVYVNIWGIEERPANRTIAFRQEVVSIEWPAVPYVFVPNDEECVYGAVRVNYKLTTAVEVHPKMHAKSYKQVYVDGILVEETLLNSDSYGAMTGIIYHASDCIVTGEVRPDTSSSAVFPYIGWTSFLNVKTVNGEVWPYVNDIGEAPLTSAEAQAAIDEAMAGETAPAVGN